MNDHDFFGQEIEPGNFFCMAFRNGNAAEIKVGVAIKFDDKGRLVARLAGYNWSNRCDVQPKNSLLACLDRLVVVNVDTIPEKLRAALTKAIE